MGRDNEKVVVVVEFETSSDYLTAQEARAITNARRQKDVEKFFPLVIQTIRELAEAGGCTVSYSVRNFDFCATADKIAKQLKELGYTVSVDANYIHIQW